MHNNVITTAFDLVVKNCSKQCGKYSRSMDFQLLTFRIAFHPLTVLLYMDRFGAKYRKDVLISIPTYSGVYSSMEGGSLMGV